MKYPLYILALLAIAQQVSAAVGDEVSGTGTYVAEGVSVKWVGEYLQTSRANSTRLYDSNKGAEWTNSSKPDSLMCWLHASSNVIQYWQSYYAIFAKPQRGTYYDPNTGFIEPYPLPEVLPYKPLPYGRLGTEDTSSTDESQTPVPDGQRLEVARDMFNTIPNPNGSRNRGGVFAWAAEWFFRGADVWPAANGQININADGFTVDTGGYYANYFGTGEFFQQDLSYTTVYSDVQDKVSDVHNTTHGSPFRADDTAAVKNLLLKGFGVEDGVQAQSGMITTLGTTNSYTGNGHVITCYGFTTDDEGNLKSLLVADNNGNIDSTNSMLVELFVKVSEYTDINGVTNKQIGLYRNAALTNPFSTGEQGGVNCITSISYINTPDELKNMLAEYSDTANEAQVWNGAATEWKAQQANVEELPTASTGWDINVDGEAIAEENRGYYHTYATEGRRVLFDDHAAEGQRSVTIEGSVAASHIDVAAAGYEFKAGTNAELQAGASLAIRSLASLHSEVSLHLQDLILETGAALSSTHTISVDGGVFHAKGTTEASTYTLRSATTPPGSIDADLDLTQASAIILENTVNMNGNGLYLHADTPITLNLAMFQESMACFSDVGELFITMSDGVVQAFAPGTDLTPYLTFTYNNAPVTGAYITYSATGDIFLSVPEPSSASLGVLALAALAMRRRRPKTHQDAFTRGAVK